MNFFLSVLRYFFLFFVKLDEKWYQWPEPVEQIILCQSLIYYKRLRSLLFSRSSLKTSFDTTDTVLRCGGKGEKRRRENNVKLFYRCETLLFSRKKVTTALPFYYYVVQIIFILFEGHYTLDLLRCLLFHLHHVFCNLRTVHLCARGTRWKKLIISR